MKNIMAVFGTRPEAIKMCPLVKELYSRVGLKVCVCLTGQHDSMLKDVMSAFDVAADYDLSLLRAGQSLSELTASILMGVGRVIDLESPDILLVHGDTATAFAAALSAFYKKIPVGHIEAGLRTGEMSAPFPEELNRRAISLVSEYDFAPTSLARDNLIKEGKSPTRIFVTGNTVIDALRQTVREDYFSEALEFAAGCRLVLLTAHRRESIGKPMRAMFRAIRRVAEEFADVRIVYPVHKNPAVRRIAEESFSGCERILLTEPLGVVDFHNIMKRSYIILTDSGGIQEEAPALQKPILLMRDTTERPEGVSAGAVRVVGCEEENIYESFKRLLVSESEYAKMTDTKSLYGDGNASKRIADIIEMI